jgi:HNH endonuclease
MGSPGLRRDGRRARVRERAARRCEDWRRLARRPNRPNGDLSAVLREAVRCALEMHGKRKGAVEPSRKVKAPAAKEVDEGGQRAPMAREPIPAAVRREVWKRDGGTCSWRGDDGRRCGSTWKLELDHVVPAALGGRSTVNNLRICCASHNRLHAEQIFGRAHMERFRRGATPMSEGTIAGRSGPRVDSRSAEITPGTGGAPP